jgi:dTDP-4-amino-4,6-dideoxygalactose transaminase
MKKIPFNKPYVTGNEINYISDVLNSNQFSGNGKYTKECQNIFKSKYGIKKCLLTTSCTDALEMAAILVGIEPGDEVIMPSYTFVSTANAFVLRGAKIIFLDSRKDHPGINEDDIEANITSKTKAIVPVHYAGVSCDMEKIMKIAEKHSLFVIEDAAQAVDSFFIDKDLNQKPLGSIGHLATFSFHETKNVISGEGGLLAINDERFMERAEIIWEKGTNRSAFFRGEVNKYGWVDLGSSFLPSELIAAFLKAQIENVDVIQKRRKEVWNRYYSNFQNSNIENLDYVLPKIPNYATNNAHMFYIICKSQEHRSKIIQKLKEEDIHAVFHYISLHKSEFAKSLNTEQTDLKQSDFYTNHLLRLPLYFELENEQIDYISKLVIEEF